MDNFDNIKNIWQSERADSLPNVDIINMNIKKYKSKKRRTIFLLISMLIICFIIMINVWFSNKSTLWTTRLGEILVFMTIAFTIYINLKLLQKSKAEELLNNEAFLSKLKKEQVESETETKQRRIAFAILSLAYVFYIYEKSAGSIQTLITGYGLLVAVIIVIWFIYRPIALKKEQQKIARMIHKIDSLKKQII